MQRILNDRARALLVALTLVLVGGLIGPAHQSQAASAAEIASLTDFYTDLDGPNWADNTNWLTGDPCTNNWAGITCDGSGNVTGIFFDENGLNGSLDDVDFSGLANLTRLELVDDAALTGTTSGIDLSSQTLLEVLSLRRAAFTGDIGALTLNSTALYSLNLLGTGVSGDVSGITFSTLPALEFLFITNTSIGGDIANLDLSAASNLRSLFAFNTPISGDIAGYDGTGAPNIEFLALSGTLITGQIGDLDLTPHPDLSGIYLANVALSGDIAGFDPSAHPDLEFLFLNNNSIGGDIADLDLSANTSLRDLWLTDTLIGGDIADLDLSANTALEQLVLGDMPNMTGDIATLDLSANTNLERLTLDRTPLTGGIGGLDLSANTSLTQVRLDGTPVGGDIGTLDLSANTNLELLDLDRTGITGQIADLDLSANTALQRLDLSQNSLAGPLWDYLTPTNYPDLVTLFLSENCALTFSPDATVNGFVLGLDPDAFASNTYTCSVFSDVPSALPAPFMEEWVNTFYGTGITGGCNGGTPGVDLNFCPDEPVTRGAMAVFILRALNYPNLPYTPVGVDPDPFADVPGALPAPFMEEWVEDFRTLGITAGKGQCDDGTTPGPGETLYCPQDAVTRADMAVFIIRALPGVTESDVDPNPFADVPGALPAPFMEPFVETFYMEGITTGKAVCDDGTTPGPGETLYCPQDVVTRADMAVFILRAFDSIPDPEDF